MSQRTIEVFADVTCPFTHVGLKRVTERLAALDDDGIEIMVRAWPLEWVNGSVFAADVMPRKFDAVNAHVDPPEFTGFRADRWPTSTIPALNLVAAGYRRDARTGLRAALAVRRALFDDGADIGDPATLAVLADELGLAAPSADPDDALRADFEEGSRRGVRGSPEFWIDGEAFFCPSLEIHTDEDGRLLADFDPDGLDDFIAHVCA